MFRSFHKTSFVYGLLCATLLACFIGAAASNGKRGNAYDASTNVGGLGLSIVSHDLNILYHYRRKKQDDKIIYKLFETIDLSKAGRAELEIIRIDTGS